MRRRTKRVWGVLIGLALLTIFLGIAANTCISSYVRWGLVARTCPDGRPVAGVKINASNLARGGTGYLNVSAVASYTTGPAYEAQSGLLSRFDSEVEILRDGEPVEFKRLEVKSRNKVDSHKISLPQDLPDGHYVVRATVDTALGKSTHDLKVGLFAPAQVHVLTDRPLYEPGNDVLFRTVFLRARDLVPLAGRPVTFVLVDPSGLEVFQENAVTDDWGVASGSVPLDQRAPNGRWTLRVRSGEDQGQTPLTVEPFTLPRFSVAADFGEPFLKPGDTPTLQGTVRFASGAPVSGARIDIQWSASGAGVPSTAWRRLPERAVAGRDGRFSLQLPRIPISFVGRSTQRALLTATDDTGDRVSGGAQLLISRDGLAAQTETEMNGGLAKGFNNRVYLRLTTPDGRRLANTKVLIRRAWDDSHEPVEALTDASAVASLQIDPGPPVNVIIEETPPLPPPPPVAVQRLRARDTLRSAEASLADQIVLDGVESKLTPCTRFVPDGGAQVDVRLLIEPSGGVVHHKPGSHLAAACVAKVLKQTKFSRGKVRALSLSFQLQENSAELNLQYNQDAPSSVQDALRVVSLDARRCASLSSARRRVPAVLVWRTVQKGRGLKLSWYPERGHGARTSLAETACIKKAFAAAEVVNAVSLHPEDDFGSLFIRVVPVGGGQDEERPVRTRIGYELAVAATIDGRPVSTKVFLPPAQVPDLRLRLRPVLPRPGDTVSFEFLRGPNFRGDLPRELYARDGRRGVTIKLEKGDREGSFTVPSDGAGWWILESGRAHARFFVRDDRRLSVTLAPDKEVYRPGDTARLRIETKVGDKSVPAAVGLIGVDESLGQLVSLPGPGAYEQLVPAVPSSGSAFAALEARALAAGQIAGDNAAAAVVLRVSGLPPLAALDRQVYAQGQSEFDPGVAVTDGFYAVLEELYGRVRVWEKETPKGQSMTAATMARLFDEAAKAAGDGTAPTDAYERPLSLGILPEELLALVDPRVMIADGTRLPEDVENWTLWVEENAR